MQAERQPDYPLLYSLQGFNYCDLLLAEAERAAWQIICSGGLRPPEESVAHRATLQAVSLRTARTLKWAEKNSVDILSAALHHLTLGRVALCEAIMAESEVRSAKSEVERAVDGLRRAGQQLFLPCGLLTRAWLRFFTGARTGPGSAREDLDEAWETAKRGPMKLFLTDIHLHRARLFFREKEYPKEWISPQADLAAAEKLIKECGYHRRDQELADAKKAILG